MAVTIRDVARAAGVSMSTVSRALSSPDQVAAETRDRVEAAARAMSYRPNRAARGLITGRTGNLGLVVPDLENPFFGSICKGVQARARAAGYAVFIADTDEDPAAEVEVVRSLARQVDGLILCSSRGTDQALERLASECRLVLLNRRFADLPSLVFDNEGGARAVTRHLVALGHRRIAYAGGPTTSWSQGRRLEALQVCCDETPGLDLVDLGHFPPVFAGGVQAADLALASGATAVVGFNDLVAVGVLDRLHQRGVTVPHDLSVTGFDDVPIAGLASPSLTTVHSPRLQMGRASVDLLLAEVLGQPVEVPAALELTTHLVVRESTGVAAALAREPVGRPAEQPA